MIPAQQPATLVLGVFFYQEQVSVLVLTFVQSLFGLFDLTYIY